MSDISEAEWKKALTSIVEDLTRKEYNKLLELLDEISKSQKAENRQKLPQIIIQCYGLEGSIVVIVEAMEELPRRDPKIQNLLQPYAKKLKAKEEEKNGSKRKTPDPQTEEETANKMIKLDPKTKEQIETGGAVPVRSESTMADQPTMETPSWRKPIRDLTDSKEILLTDTIGGKVICKSPLHTSKTKKFFFYVSVADETAGLRLMVYGKPHHQEIKKGNYYSFRKLIKDEAGHVKVTSETIVAEIGIFSIPEEVEKEARQLCSNSPLYTIKDFKTLDSGTGSTKGTITEVSSGFALSSATFMFHCIQHRTNIGDKINPSKSVPVKNQEKKTEKRQSFRIEDDTDSIEVVFWGDKTQQCKNLSVGDVIVLNNVKINRYYNNVSLQSTHNTDIEEVCKVGSRNVKIEIFGITKAQKRQTHLEVKLDQKNQTLMVASKLLAEAFGLNLEENFKSQFVKELPMLAEALIKGNKIKKITRIQN